MRAAAAAPAAAACGGSHWERVAAAGDGVAAAAVGGAVACVAGGIRLWRPGGYRTAEHDALYWHSCPCAASLPSLVPSSVVCRPLLPKHSPIFLHRTSGSCDLLLPLLSFGGFLLFPRRSFD